MAIVANKDGQGIIVNGAYGNIDPSYDVPTLFGAVFPAVASAYAGQLYLDNVTGHVYRSLVKGSATAWAETNIR